MYESKFLFVYYFYDGFNELVDIVVAIEKVVLDAKVVGFSWRCNPDIKVFVFFDVVVCLLVLDW